jgi:hypothetical protein
MSEYYRREFRRTAAIRAIDLLTLLLFKALEYVLYQL